MSEKPPLDPQVCPVQMPVSYFGAMYQDSQCIDGYLWDLDSCDEPCGPLHNGGDIPCPFCNPEEHVEYLKDDEDLIICEVCATELKNLYWAETSYSSVKLYGYCSKCQCNQWAEIKESEYSEDD